ncbi:MAG: hypothetical protein HOM96_04990 [Rickettsiales bacterium]|nr:hypothetical protein [Rickettsiales bacterium]
MRCYTKLAIFLFFLIVVPLLLVQTSRKISPPESQIIKTYTYSYDELYEFVYNSTNEIVRLEDEARQIFAQNFALQYQDKEISFEDMFSGFISRRNFLLPAHDLMFKLGLIEDYYHNPYMTLLIKDPDNFAKWVAENAAEYQDIFALYAMKLQFIDSSKSDKAANKLLKKIYKSNKSPNHLIEVSKIALIEDNNIVFLKAASKLTKYNSDDLLNAGFLNDYLAILANYYYMKDEAALSYENATLLLDVFKGDEFFYPFTRYVDSFSDVMVFLGEVATNKKIYFSIIINILDNERFSEIEDPRLVTQVYLNIVSGPVQYLNPDYAYNIILELYYQIEGNESLNKNYFVQINKFSILSILSSQSDYYNLAVSLEEINFAEILNNKYTNYNYINFYKLVAYGGSYEYGASYDQQLVDNVANSVSETFLAGSPNYNNMMQMIISYLVKYDKLDEAMHKWNDFQAVLLNSNYISNNQKLTFFIFNYQLFSDLPNIKSEIIRFSKGHYISDKNLRKYINYLKLQ